MSRWKRTAPGIPDAGFDTLAEFAARVGAARKAVVYQWESRKRCPSPLFWKRIQQIRDADGGR